MEIWDLIQPGVPADFYTTPFQDWLLQNCRKHAPLSSGLSIPWHILFPHILWALWLRRNDIIFSQTQLSSTACLDKAKALAWNHLLYQDITTPLHNPPIVNDEPWIPPPPGVWYLNTDASFTKRSERTGIAGVIRDNQGVWVTGFGKTCSVSCALMGELIAIYEGLRIIKEKNWHSITILSDCLMAVNCLTAPHVFRDETFNVVSSCRLLMNELNDVQVQSIKRQKNKVADKLAKFCRNSFLDLSEIVIFDDPIEDILLLYEEEQPP